MKTYHVIGIYFCLSFGCQEKKLADSNPEIFELGESKAGENRGIEVEELSEALKGVWLPEDYVQEVERSKSAFLASKLIPDIAELQVDPKNVKGDSLYISSSLNNHEGYGFKVWVEKENSKPVFKTDVRDWERDKAFSEFTYQFGPDTTITIVKKSRTGKVLNRITYKRVRSSKYIKEEGGHGYDYLARKNILDGEYVLLGAAGNPIGKIEFHPETERVIGFKHRFYNLQTDFGTGPEYKGDILTFLPTHNDYTKSESFAIRTKGDTIQLWSTMEDSTDYSRLKLRDLHYSLIKKKN